MAMENPALYRSERVESTEFMELANRINVSGVPRATINGETGTVVGAVPEDNWLADIQRIMA
jgi:hypothetical protein